MAYYDRWVNDPLAASEELAKRLNISPEQLQERLQRIRSAAQSGFHLTLGQATEFLSAPDQCGPELRSHINSCEYCQAMVDGLSPERQRKNFARLEENLEAAPALSPTSISDVAVEDRPGVSPWRSFAVPGLAFVASVFAAVSAATLYFQRNDVGELRREIAMLQVVNEQSTLEMRMRALNLGILASSQTLAEDDLSRQVADLLELNQRNASELRDLLAATDKRDRKVFEAQLASFRRDQGAYEEKLSEVERSLQAINPYLPRQPFPSSGGTDSGSSNRRNSGPFAMDDPRAHMTQIYTPEPRSAEELNAVFDRNKGALYSLYSRALRENPRLQGDVLLEVTVSPTGEVAKSKIVSSDLKDPDLERKLLARVNQYRFAPAEDSEDATFQKRISFLPN